MIDCVKAPFLMKLWKQDPLHQLHKHILQGLLFKKWYQRKFYTLHMRIPQLYKLTLANYRKVFCFAHYPLMNKSIDVTHGQPGKSFSLCVKCASVFVYLCNAR